MGAKVHCESYLPGNFSMRDPNEGSSSSNWPLLCGEKSMGNGQYCNGYLSTTFSNSYLGGDRDAVRQKMLEHEAVFKHQVFELHRLYKVQKDMTDEMKRKALYKHRMLIETSSSSSQLVSQMHSKPKFSYLSSNPVVELNSPPLSSPRGNINQADRFLSQNGFSSKDCEILEVRPSKVRKKLFDLHLPSDEYVDPEEEQRSHNKNPEFFSPRHQLSRIDMDTYISNSILRSPIRLADLNEPVQNEEQTHLPAVGLSSSSQFLLGLSKDVLKNPHHRSSNGILNNLHVENKGDRRDMGSYTFEGHDKTNLNFIPQRVYSLVSHKPIDTTFEKKNHPSTVLETAQETGDLSIRGERIVHGLQISETIRELSSLYHLKPIATFTHKLTSIQTHPPINSLGTSNTSSQTPSQHQEILNKLYSGPPPSWINRSPLTGFENSKFNKFDKVASERSINYSPSKIAKEVNLNACMEIVDVEKECENQIKALPWLKTETSKIEERKLFGVPIFNKSCCTTKESSSLVSTLRDKGKSVMIDINAACDIECSTEIAQEKPLIIEKSGSEKGVNFRTLFDLNSCGSEDEITVAPSLASTNANKTRITIDLEAPPVPESDEDILPSDGAVLTAAEAIITMSSLVFEAPSPDPLLWFVDVVSSFTSEFENTAAKTSSPTGRVENTVVKTSSFRSDLANVAANTQSNEIIDDFEAATLNLREMTEEEYMPKPFFELFDENGNFENGHGSARSRARRGAGRRGTRRRDFQRDILPGLASLSRHEVSEDIQTFASLMRATGHVWSPRNRARGRGRRRLVPADDMAAADVAAADVVVCPPLTEGGDIWGETPRRPRRQRGAPGNSPHEETPRGGQ